MKNLSGANWLRVALAVISGLCFSNTYAICDEGTFTCRTVEIIGVRPWNFDIDLTLRSLIAPVPFLPVYQQYRRGIVDEDYQEFRREVADLLTDPLNTTDIRCSAITTSATRQTTSKSDLTDRYLSALQLFTAINAYRGAHGLRLAIAASPPKLLDGKMVPTFTVVYIDGGSETWAIQAGLPPSLMFATNFPPGPSGDGVPKACPTRMRG